MPGCALPLVPPVKSAIYRAVSGRSAAWFSASVWGAGGREFESLRPDHLKTARLAFGLAGVFLFKGPMGGQRQ